MTEIALKQNQVVVVSRTGTTEPLAKIEVRELGPDKVTLNFDTADRISLLTLQEWDQLQAGRNAGKRDSGSPQPHRAPYTILRTARTLPATGEESRITTTGGERDRSARC